MKKLNHKKEYGFAIVKGSIGAIPFAGPLLNELLFDTRSRIKQDRINKFIENLSNHFESNGENILDLENLNKEEIGDIVEEISMSVSKTSSELKHELFRNILFNEFVENNSEIDIRMRFISITNSISPTQYKILNGFYNISDKVLKYKLDIKLLKEEIPKIQSSLLTEIQFAEKGWSHNIKKQKERLGFIEKSIKSKSKALKETDNVHSHKYWELKPKVFHTEILDLIGKGLMFDFNSRNSSMRIYEALGITKLGRAYMNYLNKKLTKSI